MEVANCGMMVNTDFLKKQVHSLIFKSNNSFLVGFRKVIGGGERCLLRCAMSHCSRLVISWSTETDTVGVSWLKWVMTGKGQMTTLPGERGDPASVRGHFSGPQLRSLFCCVPFLSRSDSPREDRATLHISSLSQYLLMSMRYKTLRSAFVGCTV